MKKKSPHLFILLFITLTWLPKTAKADFDIGAEITYQWLHDSTYRIYYVIYHDCTGLPRRDSVRLCYSNSCGTVDTSVYLYVVSGSIPYGTINGEETVTACPGHPTTCNGGTLPGFKKWWYSRDITLKGRCDHWKFSCSSMHRHAGTRNIIVYHGGVGGVTDSMYVETTLDNLDAQGNSSVIFTENELQYLCIHSPFTFNSGGTDIDNDSLYYEYITPMTGDPCHGRDEVYAPTYYLPSNPLACAGTFTFDNSTGTESFTADSVGLYAQLIRVNEYRKFQSSTGDVWRKIGSAMREMDLAILDCNDSAPTLYIDSNSLNNASYISGEIYACTLSPFNFCFNATSERYMANLQVTDNSSLFTTTTHPSITYSNLYTDSVRGCLSWTPGPYDTGLHLLIVQMVDTSQCHAIGLEVPVESAVYAIPIYIWSTIKVFSDTLVCPGDTVQLHAIGGRGFSWTALPGGSGSSSLSCNSCPSPHVYPLLTTNYAVYAASNIRCANRDTVTISTLPKPDNKHIDTALCSGSINLSVPVASVGRALAKLYVGHLLCT